MLRSAAHLVATIVALLAAGLAAVLAVALIAGCGDGAARPAVAGAPTRANPGVPLLVTTTPMVADLVRSVAGQHAEVVALIGPGVDPHLWTPTRTDILRLLDADAVFLNGLMLEGRIGDSVARVEGAGRPVLRIAQELDKRELLTDPARSSYFDPHVWMDPLIWAKTAGPVARVLAEMMPSHAGDFFANARTFEAKAATLERECAAMLASVPQELRTLVSAHDAFEYYGRRFGLEVRGIQGLSTESEASIADIEQLVAELSQKRVPAAFIETTVSDRTVRSLVEGCASLGHELRIGEPLYSDSLGRPGTPEGTWEGMLRHNTRVIAENLSQPANSQPTGTRR